MNIAIVNRFDGGITPDPRDTSNAVAQIVKHFDNQRYPHLLTPYRSLEYDAVSGFESTLNDFRITHYAEAGGNLYGMGVVADDDAHVKIYKKVSAAPTDAWTEAHASNATSSNSGNVQLGGVFFLYYANQDELYGNNTYGIFSYVVGTPGFTYNEAAKTPTGQGLVHSKDDVVYVPCGREIVKKDGASAFAVALTLPYDTTANSICEYGNFLAIGCKRTNGTSVVYLWDRDSSLTTLSESINWGTGDLKLIENLGGTIVGVSTTQNTSTTLTPYLDINYWDGNSVYPLHSFKTSLATVYSSRQKVNNAFYFLAEMTIDGTAHKGLWRLLKRPDGRITFSFDHLPRNDTSVDAGALKGFYKWGDYTYITHLAPSDGSYTIYRTNDQAVFTATSTYDSTINPGMRPEHRTARKQLMAVAVSTSPLPSGAQVTVQYRVDGGSWITIDSETTENMVTMERTRAVTAQFTAGREYEFRISSTGGAEITELKYGYDILQTNI